MKKLIIILIFLLVFPLISSVEFETKNEFNQGETLVAVVSGNFYDQITRDNVFFYKGHVRIPMIYEIGKIQDDFYIYAMLTGKEQGNYSVIIKEVRYARGIETVDEDIVKNFTITENTTDFSLSPGFVITPEDFFLEVQNLQEKRITIQIDMPGAFISESILELKSGEIKRINFELNEENFSSALEEIKLSSENTEYSVPVFIMLDINITEEEKRLNFKFEPHTVAVSMATDSDSKRIVYMLNKGDTVEDIFISVSPLLEPYVTVSPQKINTFEKDSTEKIEIFMISETEEMIIEGQIFATSENFTSSLILVLDFIKDFIPDDQEDEEVIITTCAQIEGIICEEGETCTGKTSPTKDGICCFAPAICEETPTSQTGKIIGWTVVILVILFLFWFFRKYKKVRPRVNLLKIGRRRR